MKISRAMGGLGLELRWIQPRRSRQVVWPYSNLKEIEVETTIRWLGLRAPEWYCRWLSGSKIGTLGTGMVTL